MTDKLLLIAAFVEGAKWWEFTKTGGTMWASDQKLAHEEAQKLFPGSEKPRGMTWLEASKLRPGDRVVHIEEIWGPQIVKEVLLNPGEPVVFFEGGGFWRASQLRKVSE